MKLVCFVASLSWACATPPAPPASPAPEAPAPEAPAAESSAPRWGDVTIVRLHPVLGEVVVPHGSTLHSDDQWAIRVQLHRTAFARLARLEPNGNARFDTDLGRVTGEAGVLRVPTGAGDFLPLESSPGTEFIVLMLSDAPLEPAAIAALQSSVLGAEPATGNRPNGRQRPRPSPKAPPAKPALKGDEEAPYRALSADERTGEGRGPYLELEGGRRAATWIRFERRPRGVAR